jgi:hypothetical protein
MFVHSKNIMNEYSHTFELPEVNDACAVLISQNAEHLINYIYQNSDKEPYDNINIRVGLVIKTLLRPGHTVTVNIDVLEQAIQDLGQLIKSAPTQVERNIYTEELKFLNSCTFLDDLISLNTITA